MASPPPRGVGCVWELRAFGTSSRPQSAACRRISHVAAAVSASAVTNRASSAVRSTTIPALLTEARGGPCDAVLEADARFPPQAPTGLTRRHLEGVAQL